MSYLWSKDKNEEQHIRTDKESLNFVESLRERRSTVSFANLEYYVSDKSSLLTATRLNSF